uniref:Zn(2)-C6 fungal-type domain-containing protein n=1 Tax=Ganoderma boninense TaxID=34458 RepID=A0A5K1K3A8_9APHY|nr:Zn(2)-C6 fungal-type domain-containing protein [Ganoderma boninense]
MSWAAKRQTTKVEDEAYSLLGIFDIQMSPLYGEGRRAFRRLQEEILRRIPDQTIFAWGDVYPKCFTTRTVTMGRPAAPKPSHIGDGSAEEIATASPPSPRPFNFYVNGAYMMFADSPGDFAGAGKVVAIAHDLFSDLLAPFCDTFPQEYSFTPYGIRIDFPLLPLDRCLVLDEEFHPDEVGSVDWYLAVLACQRSDFPGQLLCCVCRMPAPRPPVSTLRRGYLLDARRADPMAADAYSAIVRLSLVSDNAGHCGYSELRLRPHTVYLEHPARALPLSASLARHFGTQDSEGTTTEAVTFTLPKWSRSALDTQGYAASLEPLGLPPTWDPAAAAAAGGSHGGHGLLRLTLSPRTPQTASGLHRWKVVADFMYECHVDVRIFRTAVYVSGGKDVFFTVRSESTHDRWGGLGSGVVGSYYESHRLGGMALRREGHESVRLELGVQLASVSCYRILVELVGGLPVDSSE